MNGDDTPRVLAVARLAFGLVGAGGAIALLWGGPNAASTAGAALVAAALGATLTGTLAVGALVLSGRERHSGLIARASRARIHRAAMLAALCFATSTAALSAMALGAGTANAPPGARWLAHASVCAAALCAWWTIALVGTMRRNYAGALPEVEDEKVP